MSIDQTDKKRMLHLKSTLFRIKVKTESDVLNYRTPLLQNHIKLMNLKYLIDRDLFYDTVIQNEKYTKRYLPFYSITQNIKENGYV